METVFVDGVIHRPDAEDEAETEDDEPERSAEGRSAPSGSEE